MKTFKIFSTAALALMMAACSSEDAALNNSPAQQQGRKVHFTATIAAPGGNAGTRTEYTEVTEGEAAGTINVAWKAGDKIALIHNGTKDEVTVETVNENGSATITGDITVGTNGEAVEVCYPAAAWEWYAEKSCAIRNETFVTNITTKQDGTLKYIQDNLDTRMGKGTLKVDGDKATLSDNVKLASQIAIWKLTMQDDAETPAALSATQVSVKVDGETPVTIASTEKLSTATSSVYLAIDKLDAANIIIEATVGEKTYSYVKEGVSLALGQYYQSTVTMSLPKIVDLSTVTEGITIKNGFTVEGTLGVNVQISIAAGATVTLAGVTINGANSGDFKWAGITCEGDATIILKDGTTNTVTGFHQEYPGIHVPSGTLTIKGETEGTGKLIASSNGWGAGIGGGYGIACGNIIIEGGTITATGGSNAAGIGSGSGETCSDITISGGTVTATGGSNAAGIGSGNNASCGDIKITSGVTKVTATKGAGAPNSIGKGNGRGAFCGTVTIGGTVYWDGGNYRNDGDSYLINDIVYPSPFANVTSADLGKLIGSDGNIYADKDAASAADVTAVAVICYVGDAGTADASSATYKGLALALTDANSGNKAAWCSQTSNTCLGTQSEYETDAKTDMAGIANTDALVGHATHTHAAASAARGYNSGTHPTGTSAWFLPSAGQWEKMIAAAGNYSALITRASLQSGDHYWSSSELSSFFVWRYDNIYVGGWGRDSKDTPRYVRACLAF